MGIRIIHNFNIYFLWTYIRKKKRYIIPEWAERVIWWRHICCWWFFFIYRIQTQQHRRKKCTDPKREFFHLWDPNTATPTEKVHRPQYWCFWPMWSKHNNSDKRSAQTTRGTFYQWDPNTATSMEEMQRPRRG